MSLYSRVPSRPVGEEAPFLHRIHFASYAEKIRPLSCEAQEAAKETTGSQSGKNGNENGNGNGGPLVRMVGFPDQLNELRMILSGAQNNNVWISGPRGIGKTSLVEALLRLRAERRLSSQMLGKPFFLIDVNAFFKLPRDKWVQTFDAGLHHIIEKSGIVIIDHFDDFVRMADGEAGRLVNTLVSGLENFEDMQAIIISESEHKDAILEASTGIDRRFQRLALEQEVSFEELKPILTAHFRHLEKVHNVDFTEEVADEIIRLLTRYPGRAFTGSRPRNAVTFADRVGTFVRLNKYAEPPEIAELREKVGILNDRMAILLPSNAEDKTILAELQIESDALQKEFREKDAVWRERFQPLFKAQDTFTALDRKRQEYLEKAAKNLQEEHLLSEIVRGCKKAQADVEKAERALYPTPPRVTLNHVRQVFSAESGVPLANLSENRLARLQQLEEALNAEIFLQDAAKRALAKAYREREMGVSDPARPAGVLMFTGGTGIGKTELVKVLARFDGGEGAEPVIIRLSEYKGETAQKKLLGADPGYVGYDAGSPALNPIERNPRALVLFDEADKAHPSVFDVLMQVLEEGKLHLSKGNLIDFKDTIIVIATNALKAEDLSKEDLNNQEKIREKLVLASAGRGSTDPLFRPEFIGRVDEVIVFENLGEPEASKILRKEINRINRDYRERGLSLDMDDQTAAAIIARYYVQSMNGRSPRMITKEHIRPKLTSYLLTRMQETAGQEKPLKEKLKITFDGHDIGLERIEEPLPSRPATPAVTGQTCDCTAKKIA